MKSKLRYTRQREAGTKEVVRLLLETGEVDVNAEDDKGQTLLQFAAGFGRMGWVWLSLDTDKIDVNSKDQCGVTPLQCASKHG
jgi:ankyrin repeat protein